MLLIIAFLSRYMVPSEALMRFYESWLLRKKESYSTFERIIKLILIHFRITAQLGKPEKGLFICWPPSIAEI